MADNGELELNVYITEVHDQGKVNITYDVNLTQGPDELVYLNEWVDGNIIRDPEGIAAVVERYLVEDLKIEEWDRVARADIHISVNSNYQTCFGEFGRPDAEVQSDGAIWLNRNLTQEEMLNVCDKLADVVLKYQLEE